MRLILIRHARAAKRETFAERGLDDAARPLTKKGAREMTRRARRLRREVESIDVLASSPLVRAAETASIVADAFGGVAVTTVASLAPGSTPETFARWLRRHASSNTVAAVGHEPELGILATWLVCGCAEPRIAFRKGGARVIEIEGRVRAGAGRLGAWSRD
jgi:phosphohistidine phosphatase